MRSVRAHAAFSSVVVRPANEPEHVVVDLMAEALTRPPGLLQLDIDLEYMASPQIMQWAEQGEQGDAGG